MLNNTKRKRGGHFPSGEIKNNILLYLLDNTEGIDEPTLREHLKNTYNISEPKNIKNHLEDLRKKRCIKKSEKSGFANYWAINNIQHIANIVELYPNIVPFIQKNDKIISILVDDHKSDPQFRILGDLLTLSASFFFNYLTNDLFFERYKKIWINLTVNSLEPIPPSNYEAIIKTSFSFILFEMFIHCVIEDNINGVHNPDAFEFIQKNRDEFSLPDVMAFFKGLKWGKNNPEPEIENCDI